MTGSFLGIFIIMGIAKGIFKILTFFWLRMNVKVQTKVIKRLKIELTDALENLPSPLFAKEG